MNHIHFHLNLNYTSESMSKCFWSVWYQSMALTCAPGLMGYNPAIAFSIIWLNTEWYEDIQRFYAYLKSVLTKSC